MTNWVQHYSVTRLTLKGDNSFSFSKSDCQMIPLDIESARLILVSKGGVKISNNLSGGPFDLKCIEYSIAMIDMLGKRLKVAHFFHPFTHPAFIEKLTIRPLSGNLFETEDMGFLLKSKELAGYKGIQFID